VKDSARKRATQKFRRDALLVAITAVTSRTPILGRRVVLPLALALMLITSSGTSQAASSHAHVGPPYLTPAYVQWAIAKAINYIPLKGGAKLGPFSGALCEGRGSSIRVTDGRWKASAIDTSSA
jgi:hypothetical protein